MMKDYCNQLYGELKGRAQQIQQRAPGMLKQSGAIYTEVNKVLLELKEHVLEKGFSDEGEEIEFFKQIKPRFEAEQIYYGELYYLGAKVPRTGEGRADEYRRQLDFVHAYFSRHHFLYTYYRLGETSLDRHLFLRKTGPVPFIPDRPMVNRDARFATLGSYRFAKFMAYEHLQDHLSREIKKILDPAGVSISSKLKWTAPKVALVELVYALKAANVFNHGKVSISDIAQCLEETFQKDLVQYYRTFQEIRIRKTGRTNFIDALKEHLEKWMDNTDLNGKGEEG